MRVKGIAKRIMAFVVSLMLAFSTVPELPAFAEGETSYVISVNGKEYTSEVFTKEGTAELSVKVTAPEGKTISTVEFTKVGETSGTVAHETEEGSGIYTATVNLPSGDGAIVKYKACVKYEGDSNTYESPEIEIKKDEAGPQISIRKTPEKNEGEYYNTNVTVTVDANDHDGSGIDYVEYKFNGGTAQKAVLSGGNYVFTAKNTGSYSITAYDKAGNPSEPSDVTINIDKKAPSFTATGSWSHNPGKINVQISNSDDKGGSGYECVYYSDKELSANESADNYYKTAKIGTVYGNGVVNDLDKKKYYFYAADKAGNLSEAQVVDLDDTTPPTPLSLDWKWEDYKIKVDSINYNDGTDGSGVKVIYYSENPLTAETYTTGTKLELTEINNFCANKIDAKKWYFYAVDNCDNLSEATVVGANDANKPTVDTFTATVDDESVAGNVTNKSVKIDIAASDAEGESGIRCIYCGTDKISPKSENDFTGTNYKRVLGASTNFTYDGEEGKSVKKTYYCYAVDNTGKISKAGKVSFTIDKTPIEIDELNVSRTLSDMLESLKKIFGNDFDGIVKEGSKYLANSPLTVSFKVKTSTKKSVSKVTVSYYGLETPLELEEDTDGYFRFEVKPDAYEGGAFTIKNLVITITNSMNETQTLNYDKFTVFDTKPSLNLSEKDHKVECTASTGTDAPSDLKIKKIVYVNGKQTDAKKIIDSEDRKTADNNSQIDFDGKDTISLCAVDDLGNVSDVVIARDTAAPTLSVEKNSEDWAPESVTFTATITDTINEDEDPVSAGKEFRSGFTVFTWTGDKTYDQAQADPDGSKRPQGIYYYQTATENEYTAQKRVAYSSDEKHNFIVIDNAGNRSETITLVARVDQNQPEVSAVSSSGEGWSGISASKVTVTAAVKNIGGSGVTVYAKKKDSEDDPIEMSFDHYKNPERTEAIYTCVFEEDQEQQYDIYAVSGAGKKSNENTVSVKLDTVDPTITSVTNSSEAELTSSAVTVKVAAKDDKKNGVASGIKSVTATPVSGYNGKAQTVTSPDDDGNYVFNFDEDQNAVYKFTIEDNAGNTTTFSETAHVIKDATQPTVDEVSNPMEGKWTKNNVVVSVKASAPNSGSIGCGVKAVFCTEKDADPTVEANRVFTVDTISADGTYKFTFSAEQDKTYVFYAVNDAGTLSVQSTETNIKIDKTPAVIDKVKKIPDEDWVSNNGQYKVEVTVHDPVSEGVTSGVSKVYCKFENGTKNAAAQTLLPESAENLGEGKYKFTFVFSKEQIADYTFYVDDVAGNTSAPSETVNIQIDYTAPRIDKVEKSPSTEWVSNNGKYTVKVTAYDPVTDGVASGLSKVYCKVVDGTVNAAEQTLLPESAADLGDGKYAYTFTFDKEQTAQYQFYADDVAGNTSEASEAVKIQIDNHAPVLEFVELKATADESFGIFSNTAVTLTVKAKDPDPDNSGVASGVKEIRMFATADKTKLLISNVSDKLTPDNNGEYKFTFQIPSAIAKDTFALNTLYNNLQFTVTDTAGNTSEPVSLSQLRKKGSSSVLVDDKDPVITSLSFPQPKFVDKSNRRWFNTDKVTAKLTVKDFDEQKCDASGIRLVKLSTATLSAQDGIKNNDRKFGYTISLTSTTKDVTNNQGELVFRADVVDIAGNKADKSDKVYVDTKAPEVTKITVNGVSVWGSNGVYNLPVFSTEARTVRIEAKDEAGVNTGASGIKSIAYELCDVNGKKIGGSTVAVAADNSITFTVAPNFKGYIRAVAIDNVSNTSAQVSSQRFVVENSTMHSSTSDINITLPGTNLTDIDGRRLYGSDIRVGVNVSDTYSGIQKVEYSLGGEWITITSTMRTTQKDSNINTAMAGELNITENRNDIELTVRITDNAGNQSTKSERFSIDKTDPKIEVSYDNNDYNTAYTNTQYYKANRRATVTITERNFRAADLVPHIFANAGSTPVVSSFVTHTDTQNPDNTTHTATVDFVSDADYTVGFDYKDLAQHDAPHYGEDKFTIDKTAPKTEVSLSSAPKNGKYHSEKQTVTIKVNEHNFDEKLVSIVPTSGTLPDKSTWQWSSNGDVHTASFIIDGDGVYSFAVKASDKARNNAVDAVKDQFVIDQTKPDAVITEAEDSKAYGYDSDIHPNIQGKDVNLEGVTYKITKKLSDGTDKDVTKDFSITSVQSSDENKQVLTYRGISFEKKTEEDGIYTIEATVTDLAGNTTPIQKTFSINRFGANFTVNEETKQALEKGYFNEGQRITIEAVNVSPVTDEKITVTVNGDNQVLEKGKDYRVTENHTDGWYAYEFIIEPRAFEKDGSYSVSISATDAAGNTSTSDNDPHNQDSAEGKIEFSVDKVKPVVSITGADDGQSYKETSKEITVTFEDKNLDKDKMVIQINGKDLSEDDFTADISSGMITAKFNVTETDAEVVAYITDLAGNESEHTKLTFKLDQNWLQRFYNNYKGAFFGTVGGIAAVIAAIILLIVKKKKSK